MPRQRLVDADKLTVKEAARRLDVHVATIYRWSSRGVRGRRLPTVRLGGRLMVLAEDLEQFLRESYDSDKRQQRPATDAAARAGRELDDAGI